MECPLWHNGICSVSAAPGLRFNPWPGTVLGSDPWPRNSICCGAAKKKKKKKNVNRTFSLVRLCVKQQKRTWLNVAKK